MDTNNPAIARYTKNEAPSPTPCIYCAFPSSFKSQKPNIQAREIPVHTNAHTNAFLPQYFTCLPSLILIPPRKAPQIISEGLHSVHLHHILFRYAVPNPEALSHPGFFPAVPHDEWSDLPQPLPHPPHVH